jgi:DNA-binding CsgD family transcriptional regulator
MSDVTTAPDAIAALLPERLHRLQRMSGLPVVFGGPRRHEVAGNPLVISRLHGTVGTSLGDLVIQPGAGLGGAVLAKGKLQRVDDYASSSTISHDYDRIVVHEEGLTSIVAVPVVVRGAVEGVIYGALRDRCAIGDRSLQAAGVVADLLARDVEERLRGTTPPSPRTADALTELAMIIEETSDAELRNRLEKVHRELSAADTAEPAYGAPALAPREVDVLELAAVGATNLVISAELGVGPETVKSYLGSAMRKLGVGNRTAAVHVARTLGLIRD